jgi:phage host-nuclease inhibitor protein Gam
MPEKTPKRTRLTQDDKVLNLDQAEAKLAQMRTYRLRQGEITRELLEKIKPIIRQSQLEYDALEGRFNTDIQALQAFWNVEKKHHKSKSIKLVSGQLGTRVVGGGFDMPADKDLLTTLKKLGLDKFIVTSESPDKPALRKAEEVHPQLGIVKRDGEDQFFVQVEGDVVAWFVALRAAIADQAGK